MDVTSIRRMQANPVYAGVGPYPAIVTNEMWVASFKKLVDDIGLDAALVMMLSELQRTDWGLGIA